MSMKQSKIKGFVFFQTPENQLISHLKEQFTLKIHTFPLTCSVFFIFIHVGCFGSRNSDPATGDDPETLWASCWNYFLSVSSRRTLISQYHHWAPDLIWFSLIYFSYNTNIDVYDHNWLKMVLVICCLWKNEKHFVVI